MSEALAVCRATVRAAIGIRRVAEYGDRLLRAAARPAARVVRCRRMLRGDESDGELVHLIRERGRRGRAAEEALCRRFAPRIRLYGLRHLRDPERARDLVQAVLLGVLQAARAGRVQDAARVDRFVLGTCRNVASRAREHDDKLAPAPVEQLAEALPAIAPPEAVDTSALVRCLGALDARGRQVVLLSFQEEAPAQQIAEQLGTTPGNVRVLRHRAIAALRDCLQAQREGSP